LPKFEAPCSKLLGIFDYKDKYPGEIKERTEWHRITYNSPGSSFFAFVRNEDFSHLFLLITKQNATRLVFDVFEMIDP